MGAAFSAVLRTVLLVRLEIVHAARNSLALASLAAEQGTAVVVVCVESRVEHQD